MTLERNTIRTVSGRDFSLVAPDPGSIEIRDIAHGLAMLCRFNGQCREFYSVAEHSIHVSRRVPREHALWGLLHDAAEAYLGDVPTPLKKRFRAFQEHEKQLMEVIAKKFGLAFPAPPEVKFADNDLFDAEARALMMGSLPPLGKRAYDETIECWSPNDARRAFLDRFEELTASRSDKPARSARHIRPPSNSEPPKEVPVSANDPGWMHEDAGKGVERLTADDTVWLGDDGKLDPDEVIREHGYDDVDPFSILLEAVIAAHPDERSPGHRLEITRDALLGTKRPAGRDPQAEDEVALLKVARRYHQEVFKGVKNPPLAPLIRECLPAGLTPNQIEAAVRRLTLKFRPRRDVLLTRVTSERNYDRMDVFRQVSRVATAVMQLGVKVDLNAIAPPGSRDGENTP